ncbi:MAG: GntR family transcriptional regulator [Thermomicrobiales bacterium]|nr:GntR family transcriptional regulator [Thermomicrobiales bacterium]MCO5219729.1 GntR family transcriptional regulator [Thermomicrobiales bacterium]MCO5226146.1 GntR family transcriptional regulator [Thermomicrobiales bacterium]MCO5227280.1 GntR family transcriptional regulator [Thermomicrobiales bacterium]
MQQIDRNGRVPIYHQIATRLEQRIAAGEFPIDSQLPNERELASTYATSRTTVRQALSVLEKSGILERRRPDGTFVRGKPEKLSPTLSIPVSFVRSMIDSGHDVQVQLLSVTNLPTHDATVNTSLRVRNDEPVAKFVRLIRSASLPIAYVEAFIPTTLFPDVCEKTLPDNSVHEMLQNNYGTMISDADHAIECAYASPATADWLKIEVNNPILRLESCYYDQHGAPVEFVYTHWRADVMKLRMKTSIEPITRGNLAD